MIYVVLWLAVGALVSFLYREAIMEAMDRYGLVASNPNTPWVLVVFVGVVTVFAWPAILGGEVVFWVKHGWARVRVWFLMRKAQRLIHKYGKAEKHEG